VKTELANEIAAALYAVSAYQLPKVCQTLGMAEGTGQEAMGGKKQYVLKRVEGWSEESLLALAKKVVTQHPTFTLEELLERHGITTEVCGDGFR
jgi:hypothetical protein